MPLYQVPVRVILTADSPSAALSAVTDVTDPALTRMEACILSSAGPVTELPPEQEEKLRGLRGVLDLAAEDPREVP